MHIKNIILTAFLVVSFGAASAQDAMQKNPSPRMGSSMQHAEEGMATDGAMNHRGAMEDGMKMKGHKKPTEKDKAGTPSSAASDACDHRLRACDS